MRTATLYTDGGARGNPGPAGIGYVLKLSDGTLIEDGAYIGVATNNQAEYEALQRGLERARREGVTTLRVCMDSELIIRQLRGEYKVRNEELLPRYQAVCQISKGFQSIQFHHVPRGQNKQADQLVNGAIDAAL